MRRSVGHRRALRALSRRTGRRPKREDTPSPAPSPLPPSTSEPGTRVVTDGFFDAYPRFYETSETFAFPTRLNLRHEAMIGENRDVLEGRRVLDIASHDGRWSFAALQAGARHVTGIEGRPELVDAANETFRTYGVDTERYRFIADDVYSALARRHWEFDVVMCLGFLYHTLRYNELMALIRRCGPTYLIVDTEVATGPKPLVELRTERVAPQRNAVADDFTHADSVLSGKPTLEGLHLIAGAYGFELVRLSDWAGLVRDNPESVGRVKHYVRGVRITALYRSRS